MRYISMFSGIEAATVAFHSLAWEPMAFAEIEPFPSAVLAYHYPTIPNVGDMTNHDWSQYEGKCDLVIGGSPCQAFSVAGLRNSLNDERGNLTLKFVEACDAINPRYIMWENVPGVLSTKDNAFGCFLTGIVGADAPLISPLEQGRWTDAGMVTGPIRNAAWRVLDAQYFGVAQRRRRVFVVASPRNGANPAAVLFERHSLSGDTPPSRKKGERVAPTVTSGPPFSRTGNERVECESLSWTPSSIANYKEGVGTIRANGGDLGGGSEVLVMAHGQARAAICRDGSPSLTCNHEAPIVVTPINTQIATRHKRLGERTAFGVGAEGDPSFTLGANHHHALAFQSTVRRLTPRECERLQGFPDDYTLIPYRGKPAADGPRYKALGNSMAVPVIRWIGERIEAVDKQPNP